MIRIPVTLLAIDTVKPQRTIEALEFSTRWCVVDDIVLLTDTRRHTNLSMPRFGSPTCERTMRIVHHEESDEKVVVNGKPVALAYQHASITEPGKHFRTSHCLFLEWDAAILNPLAWTDEWLKYDFLSANWRPHTEPGWEPCTWDNSVGNFGASLRSHKFCEAATAALEKWKGDPRTRFNDAFCCRTARPWMEKEFGVKFAPAEVAMRFGCENRVYAGSFTYHGLLTATINNFSGPFFDSRKLQNYH